MPLTHRPLEADVSQHLQLLVKEVEQMRWDIDQLFERTSSGINPWLRPKDFALLIGVTTTSLARWRREGRFQSSSIKCLKRGSRLDYLFHRKGAYEDLKGIAI